MTDAIGMMAVIDRGQFARERERYRESHPRSQALFLDASHVFGRHRDVFDQAVDERVA